ncbi:MAG: hypothetical protein AAGH15_23435 [Myxococcota bacterium]
MGAVESFSRGAVTGAFVPSSQNPANPCRCSAKTRTFIAEGWVDPERLKFTARRVAEVRAEARDSHDVLCTAEERFAAVLFRGHPVLPGPDLAGRLRGLLDDPELRARLALDA